MSTFVTTDIPARAAIAQLMAGKQIAFSLSGVARLGVADHMSEHPVAVEDLARKVDAQPDALFRVMRLLASVGVFDQFPGRKFALTPVGKHLQTDVLGSVRYLAAFSGDEWAVRAYEQFLHCLRTGEDGVSKAYGKHAFDLLAERPDQAENFHQAMTANSGLQARAILDAYDFSGIKRIADVGGGHALLLVSILEAYPETTGVLHDLPEVVAGVPPEPISKCGGRFEIQPGSFFEAVPASCDAYIAKHIIHDWDDEHCRKILRLMREQLPATGRVLICDMVMPHDSAPSPVKVRDIDMLVMTPGGRERTAEEFRALFASADLRLSRIVETTLPICIIEGVAA
jgi:hypothetical protein